MAKKKTDLSFDLEDRASMTVEVKGEGTYKVPLPGSLPLATMRNLWKLQNDESGEAALDWFYDFFKKYIGDAIDEFTLDDFNRLTEYWQSASNPSLGES